METYWKTVYGYCPVLEEEHGISIEIKEFMPLGSSQPFLQKCCYDCDNDECSLPTCPIYESSDFQ